jgi:hypothetical protein
MDAPTNKDSGSAKSASNEATEKLMNDLDDNPHARSPVDTRPAEVTERDATNQTKSSNIGDLSKSNNPLKHPHKPKDVGIIENLRLSLRGSDKMLSNDNYLQLSGRSNNLCQSSYISTAKIIRCFFGVVAALTVAFTIVTIALIRRIMGPNMNLKIVPSLVIMDGNCSSLRIYNIIAHVILNAVGTVVLGASNYLQQICTSPTAKQVGHLLSTQGDIKFGSNMPVELFKRKGWKMKLFWVLLILTSIPVHVLINGVVGYEVNNTDPYFYALYFGNSSSSLNCSDVGLNVTCTTVPPSLCVDYINEIRGPVINFESIVVVVKSSSKLQYYQSMVSQLHHGATATPDADDISTCFLELVPSKCWLGLRWFELIAMSGCLVSKFLVVYLFVRRIIRTHSTERLFNSIGDFIVLGASEPAFHIDNEGSKPASLEGGKQTRWLSTLGFMDFIIWAFWFLSILSITLVGFLGWRHVSTGLSLRAFAQRYPLGSAAQLLWDPHFYSDNCASLFVMILSANSPQLWLSTGYFLWNNQLTRIWMEHEWRSYYHYRKVPRISHDANQIAGVRSTRFLQLPYAATAFLMTINTILHWLVSEARFVINGVVGFQSDLPEVVWSPFALILIGIITSTLLVATSIYYILPVRTKMPVMAGSARVVFDACVQLREPLPLKGIQWGDISIDEKRILGFGEVVGKLKDGVTFQGVKDDELRNDE